MAKRIVLVGLAVAALAVSDQPAQGCGGGGGGGGPTTWYVRKTGSDTNTGLSPAQAFRTISKAAAMANAGDTVYVGAGTYAEQVTLPKSGTAFAYISFIADVSGAHTGDAGAVIVDGAYSRNHAFYGSERSYIRISGFTMKQCKEEAVYLSKSTGAIIENCEFVSNKRGIETVEARGCLISGCAIRSSTEHGIRFGGKYGPGSIISQCRIYSNGKDGIESTSETTTPTLIVNCMLYENDDDGVCVHTGYTTIYNCTLVGNDVRGIHIKSGAHVVARNNIVAFNGGHGIKNENVLSSNYNLLWGNSSGAYTGASPGANDVFADPLFVSRPTDDYSLTSASPAINKGTLEGAPTVDYLGQARRSGDGWIDIGADEYGQGLRVISWRQVER